jgi:ParB-like nuclease domain
LEPDLRIVAPAHATGAVEFVELGDISPDESFRLRADGDVTLLATSLGRLGQLSPVELRPWPGAGSDGPRWQVVAGFRRLAAVRLLARERVLSRVHGELADEDAWGLALAEALLREPLAARDLEALRERLRASGVAPWADELVDEALVRAPLEVEVRERFYAFLRGEDASVRPERSAAESKDEDPTPTPTGSVHAEPFDSGRGEAAAYAQDRLREAESKDDAPLEVTADELAQDLSARLSALNQDLALAFEAWSEVPPEGRRAIVEQARYISELMPFLVGER